MCCLLLAVNVYLSMSHFTLNISYLQLLYGEVQGILLYQGFPRLILLTKHPERSEGCFVGKIGRGNPQLNKFFSHKIFAKWVKLFYLIVPRDVK